PVSTVTSYHDVRRSPPALDGRGTPPISLTRSVAHCTGRGRDRAYVDFDGAVMEGHLPAALHVRRSLGVRLLRDVLRGRHSASPHGGGPAPALQDVGVSGHADRVHPVFSVACDQHRARTAA